MAKSYELTEEELKWLEIGLYVGMDEYPEYGYTHCTCDECGYYKGCEDCCFADKDDYCTHEVYKEVSYVSGT